jgi:RNA polymerase sigma factor (sigma-70 family)
MNRRIVDVGQDGGFEIMAVKIRSGKKILGGSYTVNKTVAKPANVKVSAVNAVTKRVPRKPTEEELRLKRQREVEDLVLSHRETGRKLARSLLRRWRVTLPSEEIDSVVDLSLCDAANRYSADKGASFVTFLFYHLRGYLVRQIASATQETSIFVTLAQSVGIDVSSWASASDEQLAEIIPDYFFAAQGDNNSPENIVLQQEQENAAAAACSKLDELEKEVILSSCAQNESLVDVSKKLGYSRCHISRVKKRAIDQLREFFVEKQFATRDEFIERDDEIEGKPLLAERDIKKNPARRMRRKKIVPTERVFRVAAVA